MNLSMKWLADYVTVDTTNMKKYCNDLTMSGSKVEGFAIEASEVTGVVVGKVLNIDPHPDADKLVVCTIDIASAETITIVTGATNVVVGALVPVATIGSTLPNGIKIKKGKLRGVTSEGMLCSLSELGCTVADFPYAIEDGIFLVEEDCSIGQDIHSAIGIDDTIVEFEITSNRPDCMSVIGLARETCATYDLPLTLPSPVVKGCGGDVNEHISVEVQNTELCPRYMAKIIKNVKVEPSPRFIRERLRSSGIRPINNLVDITNYVMLEYGQPLHAFDYSCLNGGKIVVRNAKQNETILTLDGTDRELSDNMLVIADNDKPVAVAGVMGGELSGITDNTKTVVLESANFHGSSVRITAKQLAMRSDSSARFEKGLNPQNTTDALLRACELIELIGAGEVVDGTIDIDNTNKDKIKIPFDHEWLNKFIGISISKDDMIKYLNRAYFEIDGDNIIVPYFRTDVFHKADIAEEVARIYGYDNIPTTTFGGTCKAQLTPEQQFERTLNQTLRGCGLNEITTYSFISPKYYDKINLDSNSPLRDCVTIINPLGEDTSVMRTTTLPSMLETLARNSNYRNEKFYAYEIGNEYIKNDSQQLPDENLQITIGMYGDCDYYKLKGIIETMLDKVGVCEYDIRPVSDNPTFHPGRTAEILVDGNVIGILGEVHPVVLNNYSITNKCYLAKFDFTKLFNLRKTEINYAPVPKFPASTRDLSLVCLSDLPIIEIEKCIKANGGKILESVKMFDVYTGEQIDNDKKSVSYSLVLRSLDSTLTDEQADNTISKILKGLKQINVELRA